MNQILSYKILRFLSDNRIDTEQYGQNGLCRDPETLKPPGVAMSGRTRWHLILGQVK